MKKYIIYARVASRNQTHRNSSITSQIEMLKALALKHDVEVADVYAELGSANKIRNEFNQMMDKLFNDEADGILCMSLDRLSRNHSDFQKIALAIDTKGIQIITPTQVYNSDQGKKFLMNLELAINLFSKELISQRIKDGLRRKGGEKHED